MAKNVQVFRQLNSFAVDRKPKIYILSFFQSLILVCIYSGFYNDKFEYLKIYTFKRERKN